MQRSDLPDMARTSLPVLAAVALGGVLLAQMMRRHRSPVETFVHDHHLDTEVDTHLPVATLIAAGTGFVAGAVLLSNQLRKSPGSSHMSSVEESIELDVPVSTAYNQWTQFEDFPKFMATVEHVSQVDDTHLHWRAVVAGKTKEWDAEITEQIPDKRIAWRAINGVQNAGVVTFHKIGENRTRVLLQMDYHPESLGERIGDVFGGVKLTAKGNLKRFKQLVESRGAETGSWRGTVPQH